MAVEEDGSLKDIDLFNLKGYDRPPELLVPPFLCPSVPKASATSAPCKLRLLPNKSSKMSS